MSDNDGSSAAEDLRRIIESARRLGVEMDEADALNWLASIAASKGEHDVVFDIEAGVFGHKVTMLDFSPQELARFREIGRLVELPDRPGVVETALALSGSAAQSKIQTYPGDCDYFERINIKATTREEACNILADLIRDKALSAASGPNYRLTEVRFGSFPSDVVKAGRIFKRGSSISWSASDIQAGQISGTTPDGEACAIRWDEVAQDPGWCKLDWIVADPVRGKLANASNMLDVTWEASDGSITPLDGYLDAYFQEIYLDAESLPIFSKLARQVSPDALDQYVTQLESEVRKYIGEHPNYGKAAKRMYNVFRLTGRYQEAAYIRELFDEPTTVLYQMGTFLRTMDEALQPGSEISAESILAQADSLITQVVKAFEGDAEAEVVKALLQLRSSLAQQEKGDVWLTRVSAAEQHVVNVINNFFYDRLTCVPSIKEYIDAIQKV
jgi:hypothetical protein